MMAFLYSIVGFLLVIGVLVTIHEWGHFIVARFCGVGVIRFSVGFGKVLWRRMDKKGTEWAISALPFGGYVKMIDEREAPITATQFPLAYNRKSVAKRLAIVSAGPLANLILAFILLCGLYWFGVKDIRPILGVPSATSMAYEEGVRGGETVLSINGVAVDGWSDIRQAMVSAGIDQGTITLSLQDERGERDINLPLSAYLRDNPADIGLVPPFPALPASVGRVIADSPAQSSGLQVGDTIVAINGQPIADWREMSAIIQKRGGQETILTILRVIDGRNQESTLTLVPKAERLSDGQTIGRIGIEPARSALKIDESLVFRHAVPFSQAIGKALSRTWEMSWLIPRFIGGIIQGEVSWRHLNGPIAIADVAGRSLEDGLNSFIQLLAAVSISLGVMNLLPLPVLDGGHIVFLLYEAITRKAPSVQVMEWLSRFGVAALLGLMVLVMFNDLSQYLR